MNTNKFIFNFLVKNNTEDSQTIVSNSSRTLAALIDSFIVLFLRAIFLQIVGTIWFIDIIKNFLFDFKEKFGTETPKSTPEHLEFIKNHSILSDAFLLILATFLVGAFYHAYFNSSRWQATIGKRLTKIMVINKNSYRISFMDGLYHYLLSVTPFIYITILFFFIHKNQYSIFTTLSSNYVLSGIGIFFLIATHMGVLNKEKMNLFDYLMELRLRKGRTNNTFPWKSSWNFPWRDKDK